MSPVCREQSTASTSVPTYCAKCGRRIGLLSFIVAGRALCVDCGVAWMEATAQIPHPALSADHRPLPTAL